MPLVILAVRGAYHLFRRNKNNSPILGILFIVIGVIPVTAIAVFMLYWLYILVFYGFAP